MTVGPKFNNYSSKMGNAPKYKEPKNKIDPAAIHEAALQARIGELVEERDTARRLLGAATQMQTETQAKLTKAVEALRNILKGDYNWSMAREVLAELEKE